MCFGDLGGGWHDGGGGRARLLEDPAALAEFIAAHPRADSQQLRMLIRNTAQERAGGKPPKSFRALFQLIRETIAAGAHDDEA